MNARQYIEKIQTPITLQGTPQHQAFQLLNDIIEHNACNTSGTLSLQSSFIQTLHTPFKPPLDTLIVISITMPAFIEPPRVVIGGEYRVLDAPTLKNLRSCFLDQEITSYEQKAMDSLDRTRAHDKDIKYHLEKVRDLQIRREYESGEYLRTVGVKQVYEKEKRRRPEEQRIKAKELEEEQRRQREEQRKEKKKQEEQQIKAKEQEERKIRQREEQRQKEQEEERQREREQRRRQEDQRRREEMRQEEQRQQEQRRLRRQDRCFWP